jgi:uncharacterized membrane protein YphA (DoxX/SURF4 family)
MKYITHIFRIAVGGLFIFSGLVKLNDPRGFGIKLKEYFEVFNTEFMVPFADGLSIGICVLEVVLGVFLLLGIARRSVAWLLLLLIVGFTFLTFYSAYFNKVTDCGCFGDAIKLTPWQSFTKDIILLVMIVWLFFRQMDIKPLIKSLKINAILSIVSIVAATGLGLFTYFYLPFVDFLPYKIGNTIKEQMQIPANAPKDVYKTTLIYQKDGVKQAFTEENYPWEDSTWTWVETRNDLITKGYKPPIHDFDIKDLDGNAYTDDVLDTENIIIITTNNVAQANTSAFVQINALAAWAATRPNVKFAALSGSVAAETRAFFAAQKATYPLYLCDGTALKTMVRSNPGIILLHKGKVMGKWSAMNVPTAADIQALMP